MSRSHRHLSIDERLERKRKKLASRQRRQQAFADIKQLYIELPITQKMSGRFRTGAFS